MNALYAFICTICVYHVAHRFYNQAKKNWRLPWSKMSVGILQKFFESVLITIIFTNIFMYIYTYEIIFMQKKRKKIRNSISLKRNGCKTAQCLIEEKLLKLVNFPTSFGVGCFQRTWFTIWYSIIWRKLSYFRQNFISHFIFDISE